MVVFWLGMTAALLWVLVGYVFYTWFRARPPHPFRTIGRFRTTRRRLALSVGPSEGPVTSLGETPPVEGEMEADVEAEEALLLEALAIPRLAARDEEPAVTVDERDDPPAPKARRLGSLTYIVVDEEGVPEHPELLRS